MSTRIEKLAQEVSMGVFFSQDQLILPETPLPQEVLRILKRAKKVGFSTLEPYRFSGVTLTRYTDVEGWDKKPNEWYWNRIFDREIAPDYVKLPDYVKQLPDCWVLIDKTEKPYYEHGKQLYKNDPFASLLKGLRKEGKIKVPTEYKHIPVTSRFGISPDELDKFVLPKIAEKLGIDSSFVRLPREIEFNIIGNFKHPEWGKTNTEEWLNDSFEWGFRLVGGSSLGGGLSHVGCDGYFSRYVQIGFRPLVVVPTKA